MSEELSEVSYRAQFAHSPTYASKLRFTVSVVVLVSMGVLLSLAQQLACTNAILSSFLGAVVTMFLSLFAYEWVRVHSHTLTRQKHATFDESNILETYQPRARTHGHLFQPDPPTPVPSATILEGDRLPKRTPPETQAFNAARDAHYANMMEYISRANKEQIAMEKENKPSGTTSDHSHSVIEESIVLDYQDSSDDEEDANES